METVENIVREMRGNAEHNHALVEVSKYLAEIADRIEAAYKYELSVEFRLSTNVIAEVDKRLAEVIRITREMRDDYAFPIYWLGAKMAGYADRIISVAEGAAK